jgi:hypothetical protein
MVVGITTEPFLQDQVVTDVNELAIPESVLRSQHDMPL